MAEEPSRTRTLPLEHYFQKSSSATLVSPSQTSRSSSSGTCRKPQRRPVGRPRKKQAIPEVQPVNIHTDQEPSVVPSPAGPSSKCRTIHRMYSRGQKNKIAYYARQHGIRAAARHYGVHHRNVQRWMSASLDKIKNPGKRTHRKGQGRKISYSQELEDKLIAWILEKREEAYIAVSTQMIRLKALSLIRPVNPQFKASEGWLRKFMTRNNLVLRARTNMSQTLPKDLEEKIATFRQQIRHVRENSDFPYALIANMDETPIYLDLVPRKTVDRKGKKSIRVRTTNSEKRHITATICCTADGTYLPPFVVFKGKTSRPLRKVTIPKDVIATTQQKAWMDEPRMLMWITMVWKPYIAGRPALLTLDTFTAHLTEAVKDAFDQCKTTLVVIPGGCTPVLQPLDISLNKPLKGYIRHSWTQYMLTESEKGNAKIQPPSKSLILEWIKAAQDKLESNPVITKKSFLIAGISNALGGYEDELTRNESACQEVDEIMREVFGDDIMGYVQPSSDNDDPFADGSDPNDSDTGAPGPNDSDSEDPFCDGDDDATDSNPSSDSD